MSATAVNAPRRAPIWPVLIAPVVAAVYYMELKTAFTKSIETTVGSIATSTLDLDDLAVPQWGSHWVYRIVAEIVSVGFATFVCAGLARGRERAAAITGGVTISLSFAIRVTILIFGSAYIDPDSLEPWYQYVIEGLMVIASPIIGIYAQETAYEINVVNPVGFGGINRLHFLWLWFAAFWYAVGLISPIARHFMMDGSLGIITFIQDVVVNGIPAVALLVPGYYGIALLSGHRGSKLHPAARNLLGAVVLIVGFVIGAGIQYGWQRLLQWLFG